MQIVIDIPDEQIKKCLEESKYIHEDEGEKGGVHIVLLYTNQKLEFVDISRKTDFYSLTDRYTVLPKGHGRLIDADAFKKKVCTYQQTGCGDCKHSLCCPEDTPTIIEADKEQEDWHGKRSSDEKAYKAFCKDYLKHGAESLVKDHPDLVRDIWNCSSCEHTEDECKDCYPELGYKNNKLKRDTEAVSEFIESDTFKKLMESLDKQDRAAKQFLRDIKVNRQVQSRK